MFSVKTSEHYHKIQYRSQSLSRPRSRTRPVSTRHKEPRGLNRFSVRKWKENHKIESWLGPYQYFQIYSFCNSQKAWPSWWSLRPGCPLRTSFLIPIRNKTDHIGSRLQEDPDMDPNRTETHTWCPLCNRNLVSRKLYHRSTLPLLKYSEGREKIYFRTDLSVITSHGKHFSLTIKSNAGAGK